MILQYPYKLEKLDKSESVYDPSTGLWTDADEKWKFISFCRDENNSSGKAITVDGEVYVYGALIQLPKGKLSVHDGDSIRVMDRYGNVRLEAKVKGYANKQLHSQIWV